MKIDFILVTLEKPYKNNIDCNELLDKEQICVYGCEKSYKHNGVYYLTPIQKYSSWFPCITYELKDFRKNTIKKFNFPNELMKSLGYAEFMNNLLKYLELCKKHPHIYYIKYNKEKIYYNQKTDLYYINKTPIFYEELIFKFFKPTYCWEYDKIKLSKYNLIYSLYKLLKK